MSCPNITAIQRFECIGNSLPKINDNFIALKDGACDNYSFIGNLQQSIQDLNSLIVNLSAITVPGAAKAWVKFDGTRDVNNIVTNLRTNRFIYSSYNITSVLKKADGDYRVTFTNRLPGPTYAVIGTSQQKTTTTGNYTWFQPYAYTSLYTDVRVFSNLNEGADPQHVSLVIF